MLNLEKQKRLFNKAILKTGYILEFGVFIYFVFHHL